MQVYLNNILLYLTDTDEQITSVVFQAQEHVYGW